MSLRTATPELLERLVTQVLEQRADTDVIAVRARPHWTAGELTVTDWPGAPRTVHVHACPSVLAVRSALADDAPDDTNGEGPTPVTVVLTDRPDSELGTDLLSRFVNGRVLAIDAWNAVRGLFGVRSLDAAFGREDGWVAEALLAHVPATAARRAVGPGATVLTVDTAMSALAEAILDADSLDVYDICRAGTTPGAFNRLATVDPTVRDGLLDRLAEDAGPLGALVADILRTDHRDDLVALGLAARAIYGAGTTDGGKAAGRFEAVCDTKDLQPVTAVRLAARCEEIVDLPWLDSTVANSIIAKAEAFAADWGATETAASRVLHSAFEQRLVAVADAIAAFPDVVDPTDRGVVNGLRDALDHLAIHRVARTEAGRDRVRHAHMAARLAVWLTDPDASDPTSFEDAARRYANDGAWVDRARRRLWRGDDNTGVQAVYADLLTKVADRRNTQNRVFAQLLAAWSATSPDASRLAAESLVTVEDILGAVTAPLASAGMPALLVVLDGCGLAAYLELVGELTEFGLTEIVVSPETNGRVGVPMAGIAALPTVTAVSRTSLLTGAITTGDSSTEASGFPTAATRGLAKSAKATLFHHRQLAGPAGVSLAEDVTDALGDQKIAVVGVVINTIDDQLRKGDFGARYHVRDLHVLRSLLEAARNNGRAVVITADHGHVLAQPLEGGTGQFVHGGEGGERWRNVDREPTSAEVVLRGPRVGLGDGAVIAPWGDDQRYGAKAGGYHGGATPDEVLVPVGIHIPAGLDVPKGFTRGNAATPPWWDIRIPAPAEPAATVGATSTRPAEPETDTGQRQLFDAPPEPEQPHEPEATAVAGPGRPAWVQDLFDTDVWAAQKSAAGRARLDLDQVAAVLEATRRRGDVISHAALVNDTGLPERRLGGLLAHLVTICNVDGYEVLTNDTDTRELRLERRLLTEQFGIEVP